jgi:hypothetical protein
MMAGGQWLTGRPGLNPAETIKYLKDISFDGKTPADSAFTGSYPCAVCTGDTATLTVIPEKQSQHINWDEAFRNDDNEGAIVAKVLNENSFAYKATNAQGTLEIPAHDSVYLWVGPVNDDGSDRAIAYYKIDEATGAASAPMSAYRTVTYCDMPKWKNRTHAAAKGKHPMASRCYQMTYTAVPSAAAVSVKPLPLFTNVSFTSAMFMSNGTWISCVYGCCEVGLPD